MLQSSSPPKFPIPFAANAVAPQINSIPELSQIGVVNGRASLNDGFPPLNFVPSTAGGTPPFGGDFNGILKQLSQLAQWQSAGGPVFYDSAFATGIGGYPKGTILQSAIVVGNRWLSTVDNNTTNPDTGGSGWVQDPTQIQTGTPIQSLFSTVPFGYVASNALTIGSASSNATGLASATSQFLFAALWSLPAALCPIFTSAGASTTRGASAAADFAANCAIATPNMKGLGLMGVDTMGGAASTFLTGVPITSGSDTVPGSVVGENLHPLVHGEVPTITSSGGDLSVTGVTNQTNVITGTIINVDLEGGPSGVLSFDNQSAEQLSISGTTGTQNVTSNNTGGTTPTHNTVERNMLVYWNLKL
jgi:hypothetical protein